MRSDSIAQEVLKTSKDGDYTTSLLLETTLHVVNELLGGFKKSLDPPVAFFLRA